MDWPPSPDGVANWAEDFIAEAFPTLMAIIAIAAGTIAIIFGNYNLAAEERVQEERTRMKEIKQIVKHRGYEILIFPGRGNWLASVFG